MDLYYLNSRYYDAYTGRFISADKSDVITATPNALTDKNLYAYCDNNPIMRRDDGGEFWEFAIKAAIGAAINVGITWMAAKVINQEYTLTDGIAAAAIGAFATTPKIGGLIAGIFGAGYSTVSNYLDGVPLEKSLILGGISAASTMLSIGNLAQSLSLPLEYIATVALDVIFGSGNELISSALSKAIKDNLLEHSKNDSIRNKRSFSTLR